MEEMPTCKVNVYLNNNSKCIAEIVLNEAELKAVSISKSIYVKARYYDIKSIAFNSDDEVLEVFAKE